MKILIFNLILCGIIVANAQIQTNLLIPDTLAGNNITLTIHPDSMPFFSGPFTSTFAFNQYSYLGPTLILQQGENVNITVNNQIGDTTNVHWHGLHVASVNDGGPHTMIMDGMSWNPQFTVLDKASTYWYHPHFHKKVAEHAIKGAAGMIIVRDSIESTLMLPRTYGIDDFPIIVQSVQLDSNNQFMPYGMQDSILLVNGIMANFGHSAYLNVPSQVIRLRLLNAAGERTFNFGFSENMSFQIIGSDGGLLDTPITTTRLRVSPGERYEILLDLAGLNGHDIYLMSYGSALSQGIQGGPTMNMPGNPPMYSPLNDVDYNILQLKIGSQTTNPILNLPTTLVTLASIPPSQANITRNINMTAVNMMSMDGPFYFNNQLFDMDRMDYYIPVNNTEIWRLTNNTMVAHPFHIHDVQFYVIDRNGNLPPAYERGRKDVVLVQPNETVRFITRFETFTDTIIPYVFHCHILMHEDDGMMGQFLVVPDASTGIDKNFNVNFKTFPNPTAGLFQIEFENPHLMFELKLMDVTGRIVLSENRSSGTPIDISSLANGTYQVLIKADDNYYFSKIVKR